MDSLLRQKGYFFSFFFRVSNLANYCTRYIWAGLEGVGNNYVTSYCALTSPFTVHQLFLSSPLN
jgi:hypothetical protein